MSFENSTNSQIHFHHPLLRARDWQDRPQLDDVCRWWANGGMGVCALVGIGGAGKTAVADRFLQVLPGVMPPRADVPKRNILPLPERLFVFSFYDAPNPDSFFATLHDFLTRQLTNDEFREDKSTQDRPSSYQLTLIALQNAGPVLLVLDGLEKAQSDGVRGGVFGELQDKRLSDLLVRIAEGFLSNAKLLITSRFPLAELEERRSSYYLPIAVEEIKSASAVALLRQRGVRGTDGQLRSIAKDCGLHALTVDLAAGFIAEFGDGDPSTPLRLTQFDDLETARLAEPTNARRRSIRLQEYRFTRIAERYRQSFKEHDPTALLLLERICLFRLGVTEETLVSIFIAKEKSKRQISTQTLSDVSRKQLNRILDRLTAMKLIEKTQVFILHSFSYSIHPAIRDGFLAGLDTNTRRQGHEAARTGLNEILGGLPGTVAHPSDNGTLDLLEEIIHHTLQSGRVSEAWDIYCTRIGGGRNLLWRLGASERGNRICRAFAGGASPENVGDNRIQDASALSPQTTTGRAEERAEAPYRSLLESQQAIFINEWALFLKELGNLTAAARCFKLGNAPDYQANNWNGISIGNLNLTEVWILLGRLAYATATADEAVRSAAVTDDALLICQALSQLASAHLLQGGVSYANGAFNIAISCQRNFEGKEDLPFWGLGGLEYAKMLLRLGQIADAIELTQSNKQILSKGWGVDNHDIPKCNLVLSQLYIGLDNTTAESCYTAARDWAVTRDSKEILCWAALVNVRIQLSLIAQHRLQKELAIPSLERAKATLDDGMKIARDCGYGILHIDLLIERARWHLYVADPKAALKDLQLGIDDGIPADPLTGQGELLAARNAECGYVWAIAESEQIRCEAMLLQAAQVLGRDSFAAAERDGFPIAIRKLINTAESHINNAMSLWKLLCAPPSHANFIHPVTGTEYNYRAAETHRILTDLFGGILTRHSLQDPRIESKDVISRGPNVERQIRPMANPRPVFISYAHKDNESSDANKRWLDRLREHLEPLVEQDNFTICSDQEIGLGDDWHNHIQTHLNGARAALLLVSPAFLASKYIRNSELPVLLKNAKENGVRIIPVILRPCLFVETRFKYPDPKKGPQEFSLATLQAAGSPKQSLSEMTEGEQDRALLKVAQTLAKLANS